MVNYLLRCYMQHTTDPIGAQEESQWIPEQGRELLNRFGSSGIVNAFTRS
jgi:hypothetical protein